MAFFRLTVLAVALVAAAPAFSQRLSLSERIERLEQQAATGSSTAGQANVDLLNRLTQVQGEVQALRNQLEQLQNENEQLRQRAREQYVDIDTRLQRIEGGGAVAPAGAANAPRPALPSAAPIVADGPSGPDFLGGGAAGALPGSPADEQAAYAEAFSALQSDDYVGSARGFQAYLRSYPRGSMAPNAWYWLGESYYVTQNYPVALQSFETLLSQFPESSKAPDAMLKKGYSQIELGDTGAGQQTLNRVINQYPGTEVARLALSRLRALSLETR